MESRGRVPVVGLETGQSPQEAEVLYQNIVSDDLILDARCFLSTAFIAVKSVR